MSKIEIHQGHVLDVLARMPANSVDCVVTSPPYWGLRDYKIPHQVWGGDSGCPHVFDQYIPPMPRGGETSKSTLATAGGRRSKSNEGQARSVDRQIIRPPGSSVCSLCNAWRGDFGPEPTPELYLEHAVWIFRAVRRVLKPAGTLWVNIGDSYAGGARTSYDTHSKNKGHNRVAARMIAGRRRDNHEIPRSDVAIRGLKPKDMVCIPWRLGLALQADGWYLRQDIIWSKSNPMPESVRDRCTKAHEYMLLLAKSERYYFDHCAIAEPSSPESNARYARSRSDDHKWADGGPLNQTIATNKPGSRFAKPVAGWAVGPGDHSALGHAQENAGRPLKLLPGVNPKARKSDAGVKANPSFIAAVKDLVDKRNKRSVWEIATEPYPEAHYATFPQELVKPCILAGCPSGGTVLDPFAGSGTTLLVAEALNCNAIGIEIGAQSVELAQRRVAQSGIAFTQEDPCPANGSKKTAS